MCEHRARVVTAASGGLWPLQCHPVPSSGHRRLPAGSPVHGAPRPPPRAPLRAGPGHLHSSYGGPGLCLEGRRLTWPASESGGPLRSPAPAAPAASQDAEPEQLCSGARAVRRPQPRLQLTRQQRLILQEKQLRLPPHSSITQPGLRNPIRQRCGLTRDRGDTEAAASPGTTLATGSALCDVKVNYLREKCQLTLMSWRCAGGLGAWHTGHPGAPGDAGRWAQRWPKHLLVFVLAILWVLGV